MFRPLRAQAYSDTVTVLCDGVPVLVPLSAPLAASRLQAPGAVDFGLVPVHEPSARQLPIRNGGAAPVAFRWRVEAPFSVSPAAGRLAPGAGAVCEVVFAPEEAAAFAGTAACELGSGEVVLVQVRGCAGEGSVGKRPPRESIGNAVLPVVMAARINPGQGSTSTAPLPSS